MKSIYVHFLNKFPGAKVEVSDHHAAAYDSETGELLMRASMNGLGIMVDDGALYGAKHALCLSPIPKDSRRMKLYRDGSVRPAEENKARTEAAAGYVMKHGFVPSEIQLKHSKMVQKFRIEEVEEPVMGVSAEGLQVQIGTRKANREVPFEEFVLASPAEALAAEKGA